MENLQEKENNTNSETLDFYDDILQDYRAGDPTDGDVVAYIYKINNIGKTETIGKYVNLEIPDQDAIGKKFGSGKYRVALRTQKKGKKKSTTANFELHSNYDDYHKKNNNENIVLEKILEKLNNINSNNSNNSNNNFLENFQNIISICSPFIPSIIDWFKNNNSNKIPDMSPMFEQMAIMQSKMFSTMIERAEMINDRIINSNNNDIEDDEAEGQTIIETILPIIEKLAEKFNPSNKVAIAMIKATPQYKQLIKNSFALEKVVSYIRDNYGDEKLKEISESLKL